MICKSPFLLDASQFVGHFHPLLVHLPIGFLVLAFLLEWISIRQKNSSLGTAVPLILLLGVISATLACITGWVLSTTGGYDSEALSWHKWTALTIPFLSLFAWLVSTKKIKAPAFQKHLAPFYTLLGLTIVLTLAGHAGATLTHGSGYLSINTLFDAHKKKHILTDPKQALAFEDLVQPMLDQKCGSCHNSSKTKGGLSMESLSALLKGGKDGPVIVPGQPAASEIIKRISLDPGEKKFMPTDGKPPLSPEETALLKWWIEKNTGTTDRKWSELTALSTPPTDVKNYAESLLKASTESARTSVGSIGQLENDAPLPKVAPVSEQTLLKLKQAGFVVKLIDRDPILLDVTLPAPVKPTNIPNPANTANTGALPVSGKLNELLPVRENIIWLNLSGNNITDEQMDILNQCKNLRILKLEKTPITDKGVAKLKGLSQVRSINLYNTKITRNCMGDLAQMKSLRTVYLWGTGIKKEDLSAADSTHFSIVF